MWGVETEKKTLCGRLWIFSGKAHLGKMLIGVAMRIQEYHLSNKINGVLKPENSSFQGPNANVP